ncbi:MAG: FAD-dependent oxidoreductase [Nitrospirae bacterium]|nr:FAD-dependent oxidoreductase [Nitrospirota bacterium]
MSSDSTKFDAVIIGGGFYGCCIALVIRNFCDKILVVEKETDLLLRASAINQARVHTGYHYPRSLVTAIRSFKNFPKFMLDFKGCIYDEFEKIYAIARKGSKINAYQFFELYKRIGAPIKTASGRMRKLFNMDNIEEVFSVHEVAFDAVKLRNILKQRLEKAGITVWYSKEVDRAEQTENGEVVLYLTNDGIRLRAGKVFNCTYSLINKLLLNSGLPLLPLKHEVTEMPLLKMPEELRYAGITIMDGPFFSLMPYPSLNMHSFHHVRYTPHYNWHDMDSFIDGHAHLKGIKLKSHFQFMVRDAERYLPLVKEVQYVDSLYEVKTVLIKNEIDDGRPILFRKDYGIKNFSIVMGGKIDNIYDVLEMIGEIKDYSKKHETGILRYLVS